VCIIIDTNIAEQIILRTDNNPYSSLTACLWGRGRPRVQIVYGGHLFREYQRNASLLHALRELDRAGRAVRVRDPDVDQETSSVERSGMCESDDPHVIALARVSNVRLLCSRDKLLCRDFRNKQLLDRPRGNIYRGRQHQSLLFKRSRG
jgi:hypothetical protein